MTTATFTVLLFHGGRRVLAAQETSLSLSETYLWEGGGISLLTAAYERDRIWRIQWA